MRRLFALIMISVSLSSQANTVLDNLSHFNPHDVFNHYTASPKEASMNPGEGQDRLKVAGVSEINKNKQARALYHHIQSREKLRENPESTEMKKAEELLGQSGAGVNSGCYKVKGACKRTYSEQSCHESLAFTNKQCQKIRTVTVQPSTRTITRKISRGYQNGQAINLTQCPQYDWTCSKVNTIAVSDHCEALEISVSAHGYELEVARQPSCKTPELTLSSPPFSYFSEISINITEYDATDNFSTSSCDIASHEAPCTLERTECLAPNATKVINGVAVYRDCWGWLEHYQCTRVASSTCAPLLSAGCTQSQSSCQSQMGNVCVKFKQNFSCMKEVCGEEKEICLDEVSCADGSCNQTSEELSDDFGEGVSQLGTLTGVADEIYQQQVASGEPSVFRGEVKECKKHPLGIRDCCTDGGWGDWVVNCPSDLQALIKARHEARAVFLGSYKKKKWRSRHYIYCVFPSKLAGVIQLQGKRDQLGLSFGSATAPNCSGLTPEQLERIDFSRLDLSGLEQTFESQKSLPDAALSSQSNQNHIESLHQKGRAYD